MWQGLLEICHELIERLEAHLTADKYYRCAHWSLHYYRRFSWPPRTRAVADIGPQQLRLQSGDTDHEVATVAAAWFFIMTFGQQRRYAMPWTEAEDLHRLIVQCGGFPARYGANDPGTFATVLAISDEALFSIDPGTQRHGFG